MREQDEEQLRRLVQAEPDRCARDRFLAEYTIEGSCTRAFFEDIKQNRVHSHVEKLKGERIRIEDIQREARAYFGGEKNVFDINRPRD